MSELRVTELHTPAVGKRPDGGIRIDANDNVTIDGLNLPNAGALSNRNLIINGAMQIAQRGTEVTGVTDALTNNGYHTCDRWLFGPSNLGTWTVQQSTEAPDGFSNSFRVLCTTADASPADPDFLTLEQRIEAQNLQHIFSTGTTTHPLTLSFWVRSTETGNASIDIRQSDNGDRQFTASYNIAKANTWERKVIEIPSDTAAVIDNDSGTGLRLMWWLNSGSDYTGGAHAPRWEAGTNARNRNASNHGVGANTGGVQDDFYLTGVQLEVG